MILIIVSGSFKREVEGKGRAPTPPVGRKSAGININSAAPLVRNMDNPIFVSEVTEEEIRRERARARELRRSQWWKNRRGKGVCHYCRHSFPPAELTMDHIVPVIRGGKSTKGNIVPCCKGCNNRKKHMVPSEWGEYLESLT